MEAVAHDHQLRVLLKQLLATRLRKGDLVVDEFLLAYGVARADVALVNGHLEGFEIKAGNDTLVRLGHQIQAYDRVFEFSWAVTTKEHLPGVRELVPKQWGLLVASSDGTTSVLSQVRTAKRNKNREADHLARLLWRDELLAKLQQLGIDRGLKSKPKVTLYSALAAALPLEDLADYLRICLKTRQDWRVGAAPRGCGDSLHPAASE